MRSVFYREVHLFCEKSLRNEAKLLLSFSDSSFLEVHDSQGASLHLDSREYLGNRTYLFSRYTASYVVEGQSAKLVLTRYEKDPLVFVKPSPNVGWVFIEEEVEKRISPTGTYSLNRLAYEFRWRAI